MKGYIVNINNRELELMMIRNNPSSIKEIEQTEELCLAAVKRDGLALKYVKKQTPKICQAAYQENPESLQYAKCIFKK